MAAPSIKVGDEVMIRTLPDKPVGVVTYNTSEIFCVMTKYGITYNSSRAALSPLKTGKHYEVEAFLRTLQN